MPNDFPKPNGAQPKSADQPPCGGTAQNPTGEPNIPESGVAPGGPGAGTPGNPARMH